MPDIRLKFKNSQNEFTLISNEFIDRFMPLAPPIFVVVYLWLIRNLHSTNFDFSLKNIASYLNLTENDVSEALKYWDKVGLFKADLKNNEINISFDLKNTNKETKDEKDIAPIINEKPVYSPQELDLCIERSEEFRNLLKFAEKTLGKMLDYNDISSLLGFLDWLMLPMEVIEELISHCAVQNNRSIRYIEKVALDWSAKGINNKEEAQSYIKNHNAMYREIMKALAIKNRDPIEAEIEIMDKWISVFDMPLDLIKDACSKTVLQTGKGSFPYADGIITNWYSSGIKTKEAVSSYESSFNSSKKSSKESSKSERKQTTSKQNKFVNYEQRKWDFDTIEKMEQDRIRKLLSGNTKTSG